jgi:hypothetical protein
MKWKDIPKDAWKRRPTPIPTKLVPDWETLFFQLDEQGYLVIECPVEDLRFTVAGVPEAPPVKAFNSWVRGVAKRKLFTRRITNERWVVVLGD